MKIFLKATVAPPPRPLSESVKLLLEDQGMANFMANYGQYREDFKQGKLRKIPQFRLI